MSVLLDTTVLIAAERVTFDMPGSLAALGDAHVAVAAITASELLHGVERARDGAVRQRRSEFVEGVLTNVPVIPSNLAEARAHARTKAELAAAGLLNGAHDLEITATSLVAGSAVASVNTAQFSRVSGLSLGELRLFMQTRRPRGFRFAESDVRRLLHSKATQRSTH